MCVRGASVSRPLTTNSFSNYDFFFKGSPSFRTSSESVNCFEATQWIIAVVDDKSGELTELILAGITMGCSHPRS